MENPDTINVVSGWRRLLLWLMAAILRLWCRTLRFEADAATQARLANADEAMAIVIWHNRLFISAEYFSRYRTRRSVYALVSASKDGALIAEFYRMVGLKPLRGSSSNFARESGKALIEVMRAGHDIGITPDGPRGPMYEVKPGALVVTRRTNSPMLLIGAEFMWAKRLRSWDRIYIPWPFSRVVMRCTILPAKKTDGEKWDVAEVRAELLAINPDRLN